MNFIWLERKVTEWGCMQALIDFDGWRKWKDFTNNDGGGSNEGKPTKTRHQRIRIGKGSADVEGKRIEASNPIKTVG